MQSLLDKIDFTVSIHAIISISLMFAGLFLIIYSLREILINLRNQGGNMTQDESDTYLKQMAQQGIHQAVQERKNGYDTDPYFKSGTGYYDEK